MRDNEGEEYLLSCAHVLRNPDSPKRKEIIQPGAADMNRQPEAEDIVADLTTSTEFTGARLNRADAGVAFIRDGVDHAGNVFPRDGRVARVPSDLDEFLEDYAGEVWKLGRSTGRTTGRINAWNLMGLQAYYREYERAFAFERVIEVLGPDRAFAKPGDSGSLVVTRDGNVPLGMVFSGHFVGRRTFVYLNPIDYVLNAVRKELIRN